MSQVHIHRSHNYTTSIEVAKSMLHVKGESLNGTLATLVTFKKTVLQILDCGPYPLDTPPISAHEDYC